MEKKTTDYVAKCGKHSVLVETEQKQVREEVIGRYKACRKAKKMTQSELAQITGISQPNITRFESGRFNPSLDMMVRIATALDMKLDIQLTEK